ncbi:MAG: hypothetical protein HIU91_10400 [Acidobacteria bacterium]|nr:hypothetical protein [Acidobacteriota bacterium]
MAFAATSESKTPVRIEKTDVRYSEGGADAPVCFEMDPRWLCVQRLINTESFAKASRLSCFLLYIVERFLQGRTDEITEQQIGVHVFGRPTDYNPGDDNIVRQTARQLRQRLALYYQEEGRKEHIQVVVPRGGYVPQFQYTSESSALAELIVAEPANQGSSVEKEGGVQSGECAATLIGTEPRRRGVKSAVLVGFGLLLGVAIMLLGGAARARLLHPPTEADHLWNVLFTPNQRTIIVPGDAGINMYGNLAKAQVDASDYASGAYLRKPDAQTPSGFTWAPFATRRYTTLSDLTFVSSLLQLPNINRSRMELRFARDITFQDLQDSNAILIGSPNYDPWIQVFDKNQNFRMVYDGAENSISVQNRKPLKGEPSSYKWSTTDPQRTGYAIIALTDNLESTGKVLLVQGTAMGGVDAATEFLFHSGQIDPIIRDAIDKSGKPANFELLLQTTMYFGGSMKAKVIAERIHSST